jgi:hypothetical protein
MQREPFVSTLPEIRYNTAINHVKAYSLIAQHYGAAELLWIQPFVDSAGDRLWVVTQADGGGGCGWNWG